jgi:hypothetical protein
MKGEKAQETERESGKKRRLNGKRIEKRDEVKEKKSGESR